MFRSASIRRAALIVGFAALGCGNVSPERDEVTSEVASALMAIDPPISAEIEINPPKLDRGTSSHAKVAFGAGQYLVVWAQPTTSTSPSLFGTRITANGEVLDPSGFYIGSGYPAEVAFAGDQFLVVSTPTTDSPSGDIRATRISSAGKVLDPGGVVVSAHDGSKLTIVYPTVASDGVDFMVAWCQDVMLPEINRTLRVARVRADGTVLDPGGRLVSEFVPWGIYPGIAFDGNQYLVAWNPSPGPLFGMRISKSGGVIDPMPIIIEEAPVIYSNVNVAFDGTNFFVGSSIDKNGTPTVRIRRVAKSGAVDPVPIEIAPGVGSAIFSHFGFDGKNLLVTLDDAQAQKAYTFHLTPAGSVVEPSPVLVAEKSNVARVASNGTGAFVVWNEPIDTITPAIGHAMGTRMDWSGATLDSPPLPMSVRANPENAPRVAFDGLNYVLARRDPTAFVLARVSPANSLMGAPELPFPNDPSGFISHVVSSGNPDAPTWIVATAPEVGGYPTSTVVRLASDGSLLDSMPMQTPKSYFGPLVWRNYVAAADPEGALFLGEEIADTGMGRPFAVRFTNDGVQSAPLLLNEKPCFPHSLTFDGTQYLATCSEPAGDYPNPDAPATLYAARLSPDGQLLGQGWEPLVTAPGTMFEWFEATFDGKNHLLFWRTEELKEGYYWPEVVRTVKIYGLRVAPEGKALSTEPFVVAELQGCGAAGERALHPAVASTSGKTFVVWSESSNPASCDPFGLDLVGVEIDQAGIVSAPFVVSDEFGAEDSPFIAPQPEGQALVAYARFVPEAPYAAPRARARFIGTCTCADGSACIAGQCSSVPPGPDDGPPKTNEPIRFGGCGCRTYDGSSMNDIGAASVFAAVLFAWRRRKARSSLRA